MSNGKIYGPVDDGSVDPIERITNLERLWPIIQTKLQAYDSLVGDVQSMRKEIADLKTKLNTSNDDISTVDKKRNDFSLYVQNKFDLITSAIEANENKIQFALSSHSSLINQAHAGLQEMKDGAENIKNRLMDELSGVVSKTALQDHKNQTSTAVNDLSEQVHDLSSKLNDVHSNLVSAKTGLQTSKSEVNAVVSKVGEVSNQISSMLTAFESFKVYVPTMMYTESKKLSSEVDGKIKDLKNALTSSPDVLISFRDEFMKKLEGVALDGTNAVLRSSNASAQIGLLEKKIENILLRLKSIELPK